MDLISSSAPIQSKISWYENDGSGTFGLEIGPMYEPSEPSCIYAGDMDSAGKEVRVWNSVTAPRIEITKGELAIGKYVLSVKAEGMTRNLRLLKSNNIQLSTTSVL